MEKPLIVHIETATDICSVSLSEGNHLLAIAESTEERPGGPREATAYGYARRSCHSSESRLRQSLLASIPYRMPRK